MTGRRYYEIDLLRFLAAFSVLLFHYTFRGAVDAAWMDVSFPSLAGAAKYGCLGVDLFFIISGFVILMTATGKSVRHFAISRIVRLYPAFWCCCTLTFVASVLFGQRRFAVHAGQYLANLTMLNEPLGVEAIDGVYWSLMVEMKFYALMALLMVLRQLPHIRYYLGAWLAAALWLFVRRQTGLSGILMPQYAACFVAGATYYLIAQEGNSGYKTVLLVVSYVLAVANAVRTTAQSGELYHTRFDAWIVASLMTGFFILFYLIVTGRTQYLRSAKFVFLGSLTYPLYLLHQNIGYMLFNALGARVEKHLLLVGTTALMMAAAWWIHRTIEMTYGPRLRTKLDEVCLHAGGLLSRWPPSRCWQRWRPSAQEGK